MSNNDAVAPLREPQSSLSPNHALPPGEIELANAHGPYTHGVWKGKRVAIGNEEALTGRAAFIASLVRRLILERYTTDELRELTVVDVGCYDGWLLCQLEDIPFKRLIGVEPRAKNLEKGRVIRQLLEIDSRVEFRQGSIETLVETLQGEPADILLCTGLFHHLSSTADGAAHLAEVCKDFLFLETICFPPTLEDDRLREALELKDLPYFFGEQKFGVTGHKLESGYYDGSATHLSVVSLPSIEALKMFLAVEGFEDIRVVADPATYGNAMAGLWRQMSAVCLAATKGGKPVDASEWIDQYEEGLVCTVLPAAVVDPLFTSFCSSPEPKNTESLAPQLAELFANDAARADAARRALVSGADRYALELLKNLRYAPTDKISLEYGKYLLSQGDHSRTREVLTSITRRLNADWRAVYRAFCLLAWSYRETGDSAPAERYTELCLVANPQFPASLLHGNRQLFRLHEANHPSTLNMTAE